MKFKTGDKVKVIVPDSRFKGKTGVVRRYSKDHFWIDKKKTVVVSLSSGRDAGKTIPGQNIKMPPQMEFHFSESELEHASAC